MAPMKSMKAMKTMKGAPRKKAMKAMKGAPMKMAMKAKKGSKAIKVMKVMKVAPRKTVVNVGDYEVVLVVCHRCMVAREICGIKCGRLTFQDYYCSACAGSLAIVSALVKPTQ